MEEKQNQNFSDLLIEQKKLLQVKIACANRLTRIKEDLRKLEINISNTCVEQFGQHDYIEERESGMYGERFYICSRCNFMR
jgi:hypothetical protein